MVSCDAHACAESGQFSKELYNVTERFKDLHSVARCSVE